MGSAFSTGSGPLFQSVASVPPSTGRHTPVIEADASEHRYRAAPITPSRAPKRRMGIFTPPALQADLHGIAGAHDADEQCLRFMDRVCPHAH
jgi:hypothetical protein